MEFYHYDNGRLVIHECALTSHEDLELPRSASALAIYSTLKDSLIGTADDYTFIRHQNSIYSVYIPSLLDFLNGVDQQIGPIRRVVLSTAESVELPAHVLGKRFLRWTRNEWLLTKIAAAMVVVAVVSWCALTLWHTYSLEQNIKQLEQNLEVALLDRAPSQGRIVDLERQLSRVENQLSQPDNMLFVRFTQVYNLQKSHYQIDEVNYGNGVVRLTITSSSAQNLRDLNEQIGFTKLESLQTENGESHAILSWSEAND